MVSFTLRQLEYAVAIADTGSFRAAAARCHVSQPALSEQVAALEDALGARLFERSRRGVWLTAAGEGLVARARRVLAEADDLASAARGLADPLAGVLRLGVIPTVSPYLLPRWTPAWRAALPRLELRWVEDKTPNLLAALEGGQLDAALLADVPELGALVVAPVCDDPFVLAAPVGHPLAAGGPLRPADLRGAPVLLLEDGHCLRDQALSVCAWSGARELAFRATSLSTLAQMVAAGLGVTLLPSVAVAVESRAAALAVRPFADPPPLRRIVLAWRPTSPVARALEAVAAVGREVGPLTG